MASGGISFPPAAAAALVVLTALAVSASATPQVYVVGGEGRGWRKPTPSDETYNHWAARNRFRVGDFLQFKYDTNDSVLLVSRDDYKVCGAARPAQRFGGGDTRFRFDHSGFFYFLSGAPGHCDAGQRMTARVMAPQEGRQVIIAPAAAAPRAMPPRPPGSGGRGSYKPAPGGGSGSGAETGTGSRLPPSLSFAAGYYHAALRAAVLGAATLLVLAA